MQNYVAAPTLIRPCCMPQNCVRADDPRRPNLRITQCRTCGAKHYEMVAEPGKLFTRS